VDTHLKSIFSTAAEAAAEAAETAAEYATSLAEVTLAETLDDHRVDLYTLKKDALAEMESISHKQVDAFHKDIEDVAEDVGKEIEKHAGEVVSRACDVLDEVGSKWVGDALSWRPEEAQANLARESSAPDCGAK
jgi:F0F1-type ATP synthase membrane subunit b/b'